jgi:hypothetical protein
MKNVRKGAGGRKALNPGDRKVVIRLYIPAKIIESAGGLQAATELATQAIVNAANKPTSSQDQESL